MTKKSASKKPLVYLAGPISGCNDDQSRRWRASVKERHGDEFEFIDPTDELVDRDEHGSVEIVRKDELAIARADAVLANMWKESIGTSIGVALARAKGKTVVIADPNHLNSRTLAYYADAVAKTVPESVKRLRGLLRSQETLSTVVKHSGEEEPFEREKLAESIRTVCRAVKRNDILAPAVIVPRVLERLTKVKPVRKGTITATQIEDAAWGVLAELEADPLRHEHFAGIREAWEAHAKQERPTARRGSVRVHPKPLVVRVLSGKSHATIWGKAAKELSQIPPPARGVFEEILRVDGIAEIRLTRMSKGPQVAGALAEIMASKDRGIIEGKCFHNAPKGQVQMFQIRVHDPARTEAIRRKIVEHVGGQGLLRIGGEES
jgi:nucleoside 2-deoxyribosyltransferase